MSLAYVDYDESYEQLTTFTCGEPLLDDFIHKQAADFVRKGICAVTLLIETETREVIGFYAISPFAIDGDALREEQNKYYGVTFAIPAWKIGELAVATEHQRKPDKSKCKRYGTMLLQEAISDIQHRAVGGAGALITLETVNLKVKKFYKKFGFTSMPGVSNKMARNLFEVQV